MRHGACPVVCGMSVSASSDYDPHQRASDPRTVRVRKCTVTMSPWIDGVHNCTVITNCRMQYTCKRAKSKCRVLCNIQSAKIMVSGMLYCVYIIQCLDRCDVPASVAIVVLIRGRSASANGSSHRVRGLGPIRKICGSRSASGPVRKRTGPQSAHH